ncbi:hypothetical protein KR51_00003470 [Rubidibacter lacunae KORDI 51-2]|uniref:DUF4336 domain-containing protein n=1 Tax=Rubidibacter lacunae KORDI 51-2 TaxID=582515 RepID=U5DMY6_9CHRO|nr:DUF4336 domain-containing protein [Rubidibacter lacunae]ERN43031.1 hypothetical protein KR51_00003470 [Rubidibacter lacunae KORDI 51-2]
MTAFFDRAWPFWPALPIYPFDQRPTLRREAIADTLWTFDQFQGIFYVVVPVRMSVIRLERGGLLVYAPIAPTAECVRLVRELEARYGEVKYIILPTASGLEHKVFVGPFARRFPNAHVFVVQGQWSYPANLPLSWLGFPSKRTHVLPADSRDAPFADEFDYACLGPIQLGLGPFAEVAFYHRRSRALFTTDTILSLPADPPPVLNQHPYPLLFHARSDVREAIVDTPDNRRRGWQRMSLFAFYFQPGALEIVPLGRALRESVHSSDRSKKGYFGLFPFRWVGDDWQRSFQKLHDGGRLFVAPILQKLILNRAPNATRAWVGRVTAWEFEQIVPCHLTAPVAATPDQFRAAFAFLDAESAPGTERHPLPAEDFAFLDDLNERLVAAGIAPPPLR